MKTFTELATEALQDLVKGCGSTRDFQKCRGEEHVILSKNGIEIDLGYEPFGPPWCFVTDIAGSRVRVGSQSPMSRNGTLEETHQEQIEGWLAEVRPIIESYLTNPKAQQGVGGNPLPRSESEIEP